MHNSLNQYNIINYELEIEIHISFLICQFKNKLELPF